MLKVLSILSGTLGILNASFLVPLFCSRTTQTPLCTPTHYRFALRRHKSHIGGLYTRGVGCWIVPCVATPQQVLRQFGAETGNSGPVVVGFDTWRALGKRLSRSTSLYLKNIHLTIGRKIMLETNKTTRNPGYPEVSHTFFRLPELTDGLYLDPTQTHWGQAFLILFLCELGWKWAPFHPNHPFGIGDIANKDGSIVKGHLSHTHGTAVDLYIIYKNGLKRENIPKEQRSSFRFVGKELTQSEVYDPEETLAFVKLIKEFSLRYDMLQIFYNDPYVIKEANKLKGPKKVTNDLETENSKNQHWDHIHITFRTKMPYGNNRASKMLHERFDVRRYQYDPATERRLYHEYPHRIGRTTQPYPNR